MRLFAQKTKIALAALLVAAPALSQAGWAGDGALTPRAHTWIAKASTDTPVPLAAPNRADESAVLKAYLDRRTAKDVQRFHWWSVGGAAYRWNEIAIQELKDAFVTQPLASRHLALLHAAIDDVVSLAREQGGADIDRGLDAAKRRAQSGNITPAISEPIAVAHAAAQVLAHLLPARAAALHALAEEVTTVRLIAGADLPSEVSAARRLGDVVAKRALARAKADRSDAKWQGPLPAGDKVWSSPTPVAPLAGTWEPWTLSKADEFRPLPPPAPDSEATRTALAELKTFQRTPRTNHLAMFWEVHGGARLHTYWNEVARAKLLESDQGAKHSARVLAALNIALADAGIACWDAKFAYLYIRPPQLDPELKPLFAPPAHPSYPAAHGCLSTAAATVLAALFPADRDKLLESAKEASEARIWAGIHYRFDIEAGQELGRKVADKVLARAFTRSAS